MFDGPVKLPNKKGVSEVVLISLVHLLNRNNQSLQLLNFVWCSVHSKCFLDMCVVNPLMPGLHQKVIHTKTNLKLKAASLFKYIWPFSVYPALNGWGVQFQWCCKCIFFTLVYVISRDFIQKVLTGLYFSPLILKIFFITNNALQNDMKAS